MIISQLQSESNRLDAEISELTQQINQLQAKKDKAVVIKSRISELLELYQDEMQTIDVPLLPESKAEEVESRTPSPNSQYSNYMKPEYSDRRLTDIIQNYLTENPDAWVQSEAIVKMVAKEDLEEPEYGKLKQSVGNALLNGKNKLWYAVPRQRGVYTLREDNIK